MCRYEASTLEMTFATSGSVTLTMSDQIFKVDVKLSNSECPKEGRMSAELRLFSNGERVEAEVS